MLENRQAVFNLALCAWNYYLASTIPLALTLLSPAKRFSFDCIIMSGLDLMIFVNVAWHIRYFMLMIQNRVILSRHTYNHFVQFLCICSWVAKCVCVCNSLSWLTQVSPLHFASFLSYNRSSFTRARYINPTFHIHLATSCILETETSLSLYQWQHFVIVIIIFIVKRQLLCAVSWSWTSSTEAPQQFSVRNLHFIVVIVVVCAIDAASSRWCFSFFGKAYSSHLSAQFPQAKYQRITTYAYDPNNFAP